MDLNWVKKRGRPPLPPLVPCLQKWHQLADGMRGFWVADYAPPEGFLGAKGLPNLVTGKLAAVADRNNGEASALKFNGGMVCGDQVSGNRGYYSFDRDDVFIDTDWTVSLTVAPCGTGSSHIYYFNTGPVILGHTLAGGVHILMYHDDTSYSYVDSTNVSSTIEYLQPNSLGSELVSPSYSVTYTRSPITGLRMYINGVFVDDDTDHNDKTTTVDNAPSWGGSLFGFLVSHGDGDFGFGPMYHLAIWDRVLSDGEIQDFTFNPYDLITPVPDFIKGRGVSTYPMPSFRY